MSYLLFEQQLAPGLKTQRWEVLAKRDRTVLGVIKWFGAWREYTFFPSYGTTFNVGCLREIAERCGNLTREHRQRKE